MNRDELRQVQSERLRETVERVYFNVPYYRVNDAGGRNRAGEHSIH